MRAIVSRTALLETLGKVKSAVSGRSATLPVCQYVLVQAGDGRKLLLTANNLEACLTGSVEATVRSKGAVVAPPRELESFLKATEAETVKLSKSNQTALRVEAGSATATLEGYEAQDFPPTPSVSGKPAIVHDLGAALKEVSYAMAKDDCREVLNGVCMTPGNGVLELAAADGFRLASTKAKTKGRLANQAVIPNGAIRLLERLMPGDVSVCQEGRLVSFLAEGLLLATQSLDGSYPKYHSLVPTNGRRVTADCKALRDALRVVTATRPDGDIVRLQTKGRSLVLAAEAEGKGKAEAKVPAKGKTQIAFNGSYLKDLLARVEGQVTLRTKDAQSPGVVKQNGTTHVLMPVYVQW